MAEQQPNSQLTIGAVVHELEDRIAWWDGVTEVARNRGVSLLTFSTGRVWQSSARNILHDLVGPENVHGLVVAQWWPDFETFVAAREQFYTSLPIVNTQRAYEGCDGVLVDDYQGMYALMQHLVEVHGYKRIAFLQGPVGNVSAEPRYRAYCDALEAYGVPLDPNLVVPGDFSVVSGREGMRILLDGRPLRPSVDFEVVVAANDWSALGALEVLEQRKIRVPEDVALTGFDDMDTAALLDSPLTTVRMPDYEMGKLATEMLLDRLAGKEIEPHATVPAQVVVRESCGCAAPDTRIAIAKPDVALPVSPSESFDVAVATHRASILAAFRSFVGSALNSSMPVGWAADLLDAFIADVHETDTTMFMRFLRYLATHSDDVGAPIVRWQKFVAMLRQVVLPLMGTDVARLHRAEDIWLQARVMLSAVVERNAANAQRQQRQAQQRLYGVGPAMFATSDLPSQMDILAEQLAGLGLASCYLALYEDLASPLENARLLLAYNEDGRVELPDAGIVFPTRQLLPEDILPADRPQRLIVEPLYFQQTQLGYALFDQTVLTARAYMVLSSQISMALQSALTAQAQQSAAQLLRRQAVQRETAAEVSRAASSILDLDELIRQVVALIRERFDLYYTGLFLVNEGEALLEGAGDKRWAVLHAGTGDAGRAMVEAGHRLAVDDNSMIGWCVLNKRARIALDVGSEATRFDNPYLPETRSELAMPLVSRGNAIGALTIQSAQEAAFTEADITVFQTMADQLANAIENARLLENSQAALHEMEALQRRYEQRAWGEYMETVAGAQYEVQRSGALSLGDAVLPEVHKAMAQTSVQVLREEETPTPYSSLVAPITQRGDVVVGALGIRDTADRQWTEDEIALVEAVVERMALAAENIRLLDETQRRAAREQLVGEVTGRIRESLNVEEVLQTAARELGEALHASRVNVRLMPEAGTEEGN